MDDQSNRERKAGFSGDRQVDDALWSLGMVGLFFLLVVLAAW